jgi:hypothetical protein
VQEAVAVGSLFSLSTCREDSGHCSLGTSACFWRLCRLLWLAAFAAYDTWCALMLVWRAPWPDLPSWHHCFFGLMTLPRPYLHFPPLLEANLWPTQPLPPVHLSPWPFLLVEKYTNHLWRWLPRSMTRSTCGYCTKSPVWTQEKNKFFFFFLNNQWISDCTGGIWTPAPCVEVQ